MSKFEIAMIAFILALIAICLVFGPRVIAVFFIFLLVAVLRQGPPRPIT